RCCRCRAASKTSPVCLVQATQPSSGHHDHPHAPGCPANPSWEVTRATVPPHLGVLSLDVSVAWPDPGRRPPPPPPQARGADPLPPAPLRLLCRKLRC